MVPSLRSVAQYYLGKYGETFCSAEGLHCLREKYATRKQESILDAIATAVAVDSIFFEDQFNADAVTPQMEEAFLLANPNRSFDDLNGLRPEQAAGMINNWKGKLFEVRVRDQLNSGAAVGDLQLTSGQYAELASSLNQPGWDLRIFNLDGSEADILQLKATDSLSRIKQAIEKNPNIQILTTEEAADKLVDEVLNSNISNAELQAKIELPFEETLDGPLEEFTETILPGLPFILIATTEGVKFLIGRTTLQEALNRSAERGIKSALVLGVASVLATLTGSGLITIPATLATRIGISRFQILRGISNRLKSDIASIRMIQEGIS